MSLTSKGFPLFLTFDLDAETMWTARDPEYAKRPILMSQGAYGWKVGTGRVLDLLDRYGIKATFFVPGLIIDQREWLMEEILKRGHELAHHSYSHTWILNLSPEEEREEMEKAYQSIKRVSGRAPRGWRSPAAEISPITMPMLVEYGFDYSSNFFDDDSPYLHTVEGQQTKIVELPFRWVLDDAPFFQYSIVLPGRTMQAPAQFIGPAIAACRSVKLTCGIGEVGLQRMPGRPGWLTSLGNWLRTSGMAWAAYFNAPKVVTFALTDHASASAWRAQMQAGG